MNDDDPGDSSFLDTLNIQNSNSACCWTWVRNLVCHIWEQHRPRMLENRVLRAWEERSIRRLEKCA